MRLNFVITDLPRHAGDALALSTQAVCSGGRFTHTENAAVTRLRFLGSDGQVTSHL